MFFFNLGLFLLLQLLHFKTTLRFRVPLLSADLSVFRLQFFPLQLERLLGLRADPSALRLLSDVPEPPLGIIRRLLRFRFDSGAENHSVIILQDEFPHIIILWLRTEGHFADGQFSIVDTLKNTYPERIFKEYRQAYSSTVILTLSSVIMSSGEKLRYTGSRSILRHLTDLGISISFLTYVIYKYSRFL